MKKIKFIWIALVALVALGGCSKSTDNGDEPGKGSLVGEWKLVSWSTMTSAEVYVSFREDNTFDLYQRVYSPIFVHLDGKYSYKNDRISGTYSDNTAWGASYTVSFNSDGSRMTLTNTEDSGDVSIFGKASIPDDVLSSASQASTQSRSDEPMLRFF